MENKKLKLSILSGKFGICHFANDCPIPDWAKDAEFCSITRTSSELSIICPQEKIPGGILIENDWRVFKVQGPLGFVLTGVVASLSKPLAEAGISIFYVSAYETDYLIVEDKNIEKVKGILGAFCDVD